MILHIYALRDIKLANFDRPMFMQTEGQMIRALTDQVNNADKDNALYMHPEDFELYELGTYDTDSGDFATKKPRQIAVASNLTRAKT